MSLVELSENIYLVPGRRGARYPHCNSIFIDEGGGVVIDPGSDRRALRELAKDGVRRVLLSHYHSDHLRDLKEFPGAEVSVHLLEKEAVETSTGMVRIAFFPDETPDPVWLNRKDREVGGWGWPVSSTLRHGQELLFGKTRLQVLHAPGHCVGHCCFWFPDHKLLYSADVDLTDFGPWYGNWCSDLAAWAESVKSVGRLDPLITVTGHEAGVVRGDISDRLESFGGAIGDRHSRVLECLSEPCSIDDIVARGIVYGEFYSAGNSTHMQEWRMVRHHLRHAIDRGEICFEDGLYRRAR